MFTALMFLGIMIIYAALHSLIHRELDDYNKIPHHRQSEMPRVPPRDRWMLY